MTRVHRGAWILPIDRPPIAHGWVAVDRGRILAVGGPDDPPPTESAAVEAEGTPDTDAAILPGLVNAHVHLELSWMRDRVPPDQSMAGWAGRLLALRRSAGTDPLPPIVDAICEARASGTALVGDVTNSLASYDALADSELSAAVFREVIGFRVDDPASVMSAVESELERLTPIEWLRPSIVPHAPYSVSPELVRAIARRAGGLPVSVHLGESPEEIQFLRDGTGPWRALLEDLGVWSPDWRPPGCGPVEYLDRLGAVNRHLIAVHGVQLTDAELARLAAADATVVTCPRSNRWTGAGVAPIERFYASGVRLALGTDSLASVEDLNLFSELAELHRIAPAVPAARLLRSATIDGAEALGFAGELGSLQPGKRAELLAVRVPGDVRDVEEYLVGGIAPAAIRWLDVA